VTEHLATPRPHVGSSTACRGAVPVPLQHPAAQSALTLSDAIPVLSKSPSDSFSVMEGTSLVFCLVSVQRLITLESQEENYLAPTSYLQLQTPIQLDQLLPSLSIVLF